MTLSHSKIKKAMIVVLILLLLFIPKIVTKRYFMQVIINCTIFAVAALSLNLVLGYTGLTSMCQPAFFGIGAYVVAISTLAGNGFWISLLLAGLSAIALSLFIGRLTLNARGAYFSIVTLCFTVIVFTLAGNMTDITGGFNGLIGIPKPYIGSLVFNNPSHQYYLVMSLLIVTVFVYYRLVNSLQGLAFKAVLNNQDLAESSGIDTFKTKLKSFSTAAFFTGVAGGIYVSLLSSVSPSVAQHSQSYSWYAYVILGGSGTIAGPLLGSYLLPIVMEFLQSVEEYRELFYGLFIILGIIYFPKGAMGIFSSIGGKIKKVFFNRNI